MSRTNPNGAHELAGLKGDIMGMVSRMDIMRK